jgi:response regulator of citrate/malate metabolism
MLSFLSGSASAVLPAAVPVPPPAHADSASTTPAAPAAPAMWLPKGLSRPTLVAVIEALSSSQEDVSAEGMALQLGLSRVSARRYLEYLVAQGFARLTPRYGAAGRPENRYLWKH